MQQGAMSTSGCSQSQAKEWSIVGDGDGEGAPLLTSKKDAVVFGNRAHVLTDDEHYTFHFLGGEGSGAEATLTEGDSESEREGPEGEDSTPGRYRGEWHILNIAPEKLFHTGRPAEAMLNCNFRVGPYMMAVGPYAEPEAPEVAPQLAGYDMGAGEWVSFGPLPKVVETTRACVVAGVVVMDTEEGLYLADIVEGDDTKADGETKGAKKGKKSKKSGKGPKKSKGGAVREGERPAKRRQ
ncbi:hypothetical protein KIPB_001599 [Kipferlia bialata]|uniref:Uncharacterized protein n=1 Tax=Kipferlia bialata TaxID=797122 RepID=A0A9K3CP75_9EUKA|nr:hypothetical protein KIPB_001599 [Kipferlia bialata]|eukprot:g1599.t1